MKLSDANLTLFFTGGLGLKTWAEVGNLNRELALYKRLVHHLKAINFVTYGGRDDLKYADFLGSISLYPTSWSGPMAMNIARLLFRNWGMLKESTVFKTNQIKGSEIPLWLKRRFDKKLIVRCGYLHGRFAEFLSDGKKIKAAQALERKAFENADIGVVTTESDLTWVSKTYGISREKLRVIPNYADVEAFKPSANKGYVQYNLVFVGRSGPQKNLVNLLKSLMILKSKGRNVRLLLIGGCSADSKLKDMADVERIDVTFVENIPNSELPGHLLQSSVFILPSLYEGNPKVLLEAMSCALPCIGTDVEGIRTLIRHKETGFLCKTDAHSIAEAINVVLSDGALRKKIGQNARCFIMENFVFEKILNMELDVINEAVNS